VQLGFDGVPDQELDTALISTIARITGGNFRMVQRLFAPIERIVAINDLPGVTEEAVALARDRLVTGQA
jgi:hypothetical protein